MDKLPNDLRQLLSQGLSQPQIFMLMGLAGKAGKRLSDIVVACGELLRKLKGHQLFAYLRKLTSVEKDFAYICRSQQESREQAEAKRRGDDAVEGLKRRYAGKWMKGTTDTLFEIYENGFVAVHKSAGAGYVMLGVLAGQAAHEFWLRVEGGEISEHAERP